MKRLIFITILMFCVFRVAFSLSFKISNLDFDMGNYNRTDSAGRKTGQWIEVLGNNSAFFISYFANDQLEGPCLYYCRCRNSEEFYLCFLSIFSGGKLCESLTGYYENGNISFITLNIGPVKDFNPTPKGYSPAYKFQYQGYSYNYNENGWLESEGPELFGEDYMIDCQEVGVWKKYDETGKCIEINDWGDEVQ